MESHPGLRAHSAATSMSLLSKGMYAINRGGMADWEPIITNTSDIRRTAETYVPLIGDNHFWNLCPSGPVFYTFGDLCEMSASVPLQSSLLVAFALPSTPGSYAKRTQGICFASNICFVLTLPWHVK